MCLNNQLRMIVAIIDVILLDCTLVLDAWHCLSVLENSYYAPLSLSYQSVYLHVHTMSSCMD